MPRSAAGWSFSAIHVKTEGGDDRADTEIYGFTYIDGGRGHDTLFTDDSQMYGGLYYVNVENPIFA